MSRFPDPTPGPRLHAFYNRMVYATYYLSLAIIMILLASSIHDLFADLSTDIRPTTSRTTNILPTQLLGLRTLDQHSRSIVWMRDDGKTVADRELMVVRSDMVAGSGSDTNTNTSADTDPDVSETTHNPISSEAFTYKTAASPSSASAEITSTPTTSPSPSPSTFPNSISTPTPHRLTNYRGR